VPQARMYRTPWALDEHGNLWREIWQGGPDGPLPPDPPVEPRPPVPFSHDLWGETWRPGRQLCIFRFAVTPDGCSVDSL
jgi:hypothetical protein